jgi:ABC-type multidrug transport system fused ATPase/permease subunit
LIIQKKPLDVTVKEYNESESIVQAALDNAKTCRTCILIAHRLRTIQDSNKITVIKAAYNAQLMKNQY